MTTTTTAAASTKVYRCLFVPVPRVPVRETTGLRLRRLHRHRESAVLASAYKLERKLQALTVENVRTFRRRCSHKTVLLPTLVSRSTPFPLSPGFRTQSRPSFAGTKLKQALLVSTVVNFLFASSPSFTTFGRDSPTFLYPLFCHSADSTSLFLSPSLSAEGGGMRLGEKKR